MSAILGIDAAWTTHNPSGVALIRRTHSGGWECLVVEPSYREFITQCGKIPHASGTNCVPVADIVEAARARAGAQLDLVAGDIPLARTSINARRLADNQVSRLFGARGCAVHSPTPHRPGVVGQQIRDGFQSHGFPLATTTAELGRPCLIEVYPHPALLALMAVDFRFQYKVGKACRYWPGVTREERRCNLIRQFAAILEKLADTIDRIPIDLGRVDRSLKQTEDMIDALVCAWVGTLAPSGRASPLGDEDAAIWVPTETAWHGLITGSPASDSFMQNVEKLPPQERSFFYDP